jgi:hypothetical protein
MLNIWSLFFYKNNMKFKSRTEAYTYTIWKIIKLDHQYLTDEEAKSIDKCLLKIIDLPNNLF